MERKEGVSVKKTRSRRISECALGSGAELIHSILTKATLRGERRKKETSRTSRRLSEIWARSSLNSWGSLSFGFPCAQEG